MFFGCITRSNTLRNKGASASSSTQPSDSVPQKPFYHSCPCGVPGQWTGIAHLNMSSPTQQCRPNWNLTTAPIRGCGSPLVGCSSVTFPTNGRSYSRVCGQVNAYQQGSTDAFFPLVFWIGKCIHRWCIPHTWTCWFTTAHLVLCCSTR